MDGRAGWLASAMADAAHKAAIAKALADPAAPMPEGARRMTEDERKAHVANVTMALGKQVHGAANQATARAPVCRTVHNHRLRNSGSVACACHSRRGGGGHTHTDTDTDIERGGRLLQVGPCRPSLSLSLSPTCLVRV